MAFTDELPSIKAELTFQKDQLILQAKTMLEEFLADYPLSWKTLKELAIKILTPFALAYATKALDEIKNIILELLGLCENPSKELTDLKNLLDNFDIDNDKQVKSFLKSQPITNNIFKKASELSDEEGVNDLLLDCLNGKIEDNKIDVSNFNPNEADLEKYLDNIKSQIEKDLKTKQKKLAETLNIKNGNQEKKIMCDDIDIMDIIKDLLEYLAIILMVYHIIKLVISFIANTDLPSPNLGAYISKLITVLIATLVTLYETASATLKAAIEEIKTMLPMIEALITGLLFASLLYLLNRAKQQLQSTINLEKLGCGAGVEFNDKEDIKKIEEETKQSLAPNIHINIDDIINYDDFCEVDTDNVITPTLPFDGEATSDITCEVEEEVEEEEQKPTPYRPSLITKAIVRNKKDDKMKILVNIDDVITLSTPILSIENEITYSPVNGIVTDLNETEIYIKDISEGVLEGIEQDVSILTKKFSELSSTKKFLGDWGVLMAYPLMMRESPRGDGEVTAEEYLSYSEGDIRDLWKQYLKKYENIEETYNNNIEKITGKDNVNIKGENNELILIKNEVDKEDQKLLDAVKSSVNSCLSKAKKIIAKDGDYVLSDYYLFDVLLKLNKIKDSQKTDIEKDFYTNITNIIRQRIIIDHFNLDDIKDKINGLLKSLSSKEKSYDDLLVFYKDNNKDISKLETYLYGISKQDTEKDDQDILIKQILYLFDLIVNKKDIVLDDKDDDKYKILNKEYNYLNNLFNHLWKRYSELPKEIEDIYNNIQTPKTILTYFEEKIKEKSYRVYELYKEILITEPLCPVSNDPYLGGPTKISYGDTKYWLKYMAMATLVGVPNFLSWPVGIPPPFGPIMLPVVYIPFFAIPLPFGFIVLGVAFSGIAISPMLFVGNLSTELSLPFPNPITALKKEINAKKVTLSGNLVNLKLGILKGILESTKKDLEQVKKDYTQQKKDVKQHKLIQPRKSNKKYVLKEFSEEEDEKGILAAKDKIEKNLLFVTDLKNWSVTLAEKVEEVVLIGIERYKIQIKYAAIFKMYEYGGGLEDGAIDGLDELAKMIKSAQDAINAAFDGLNTAITSLEASLALLPIVLPPNSASFGFSLKNPVPIYTFADDIYKSPFNPTWLKPILSAMIPVTNEPLMTPLGPINPLNTVKEMITASIIALILADPFPAYENLNGKNIGYWAFLFKDFARGGGQHFGMPGFQPYPI